MRGLDLQALLVDYTVKHSGHETRRAYIGLSGVGDCPRLIYDRFCFGEQSPSVADHLKFCISYDREAALVERLKRIGVYSPGETISLYGGLVQGHTDGLIDGRDILEIKTIPASDFFPTDRKLPRRIWWQVQGYMHFLHRDYTHVVYEARSNGEIFEVIAAYHPAMGEQIGHKVAVLAEAVETRVRPACTCGRCVEDVHRLPDWSRGKGEAGE